MDLTGGIGNLIVASIACLVFVLLAPLAVSLADRFGLVDHPDARKQHNEATPLVGGLVVFSAFFIVSVILTGGAVNWSMFLWFVIVLGVGVADDHHNLSAARRLLMHALIVAGIAVTDGYLVYSVGTIFGPVMDVSFSQGAAILFTIIGVVGAINAVNMIDGVDGLLGSMVLISLMVLLVSGVGLMAESPLLSNIELMALIGAVFGFLILNSRFFGLQKASMFMGDAGSTALGFVLVYLLISGSQGEGSVISPVTAGWVLGLPLLDASAVMAMRVFNNRSPMAPGRDHLHHILLRRYSSTNKVVFIMAGCHFAMVVVGVIGPGFIGSNADVVLFWLFVGLVATRCLLSMNTVPDLVSKKNAFTAKMLARIRRSASASE